MQKNILKEVRGTIDALRNDPNTLLALEKSLNERSGGAVEQLRAQFPKFKEDDFRLYVLAASGLSSTTIATLLDKEKSVVYNRLSRLRNRIADSAAPDKARFLEILG